MSNNYYQYDTNPRKYEIEYPVRQTVKKKEQSKKISKKEAERIRIQNQKKQKAEERKRKVRQVIVIFAIFGMLLTVSYREISIMEMFNQNKELEGQLALIEKENGQVEKSIKEVESTLDWNKIKQIATEELGMQSKTGTVIDLEKKDNVETEYKFIKEDETSVLEKIVSFMINR